VLAAVFARLEPEIGAVGAALVSAGIAFIGAGATAWTTRALFLARDAGRDGFRRRAE
jgi:hypothetical protein